MATTTVGVKKSTTDSEVAEVPTDKEDRKTFTNWGAMYATGLTPTYIQCKGYFPLHRFNSGCHTTLQLKPEQLAAHLANEHGGGFFVSFKEDYQINPEKGAVKVGRPWEGWKKFEELGIELRDFRCDVCDAQIKLNQRNIMFHCRPHNGKSSRQRFGGDFFMTLSKDVPLDFDEDNLQ